MRATAALILVVVLGGLSYLNALDNPPVFDDRHLLLENPRLDDDLAALQANLTQPGLTGGSTFSGHFRPVLMVSLWLNQRIFGDSIVAYRLVNLLLHLVCALLCGLLLWRLLLARRWCPQRARRVATIASCLFSLLPLHFSVVALVLKRASSLSAVLLVGALLLLDTAFRPGPLERLRLRRLLFWGGALVLGALAQLSKEDAAVLPLLVLIYGLAAGLWRGRWRMGVLVVASFALFPLVFAWRWFPRGVTPSETAVALRYLGAQPRALLTYALGAIDSRQLTVCLGLPAGRWPPRVSEVVAWVACAVVLALALWLGRRHRLVLFALGWALVCVAPTSSVFPLRLVGDFVRAYLASVGPLLLVAIGLDRLGECLARRLRQGRLDTLLRLTPALFAGVMCARGTLAVNARQRSALAVWQHAAALFPESERASTGLCAVLSQSDELVRAREACRRAYALGPSEEAALSLVTVLGRSGMLPQAEQVLIQARARLGTTWRVALADGRLAWFQDLLPRAERAYEAALRLNPTSVEARVYLADVRLSLGKGGVRSLLAPLLRQPSAAREYPLLAQVISRLARARQ